MAGGRWRAASNRAYDFAFKHTLSRLNAVSTGRSNRVGTPGSCGDGIRGQERVRHGFMAGPFCLPGTVFPL